MIDGERVYIYGVEGRLRSHRVVDGELLWEVDTFARFGVQKNFFGVAVVDQPELHRQVRRLPVFDVPTGNEITSPVDLSVW